MNIEEGVIRAKAILDNHREIDKMMVIEMVELIETLLTAYEKEKKEYERVRAGRNWLSERISAQIATPELFDKLVEENYINKDKIKAKIEEVKDGTYDAKIVLEKE